MKTEKYTYACAKCGARCEKRGEQGGLGTWHCPKHGKVPVKRYKN